MKAKLPDDLRWQCPLCGAPVSEATIGIAPTGEKAFGIDLPY